MLLPRSLASRSRALPSRTKWATSAICIPILWIPCPRSSRDSASSKSLARSGSIVTTSASLMSRRLPGSSMKPDTCSASLSASSENSSRSFSCLITASVSSDASVSGPITSMISPSGISLGSSQDTKRTTTRSPSTASAVEAT